MAALDDYRGQFPELQGLEQEVTRLESLLMQRQGLTRSRASSLSITVEHALESFSFLNEDEDEDIDGPGDRPPNSLEPGAEDSLDLASARPSARSVQLWTLPWSSICTTAAASC